MHLIYWLATIFKKKDEEEALPPPIIAKEAGLSASAWEAKLRAQCSTGSTTLANMGASS